MGTYIKPPPAPDMPYDVFPAVGKETWRGATNSSYAPPSVSRLLHQLRPLAIVRGIPAIIILLLAGAPMLFLPGLAHDDTKATPMMVLSWVWLPIALGNVLAAYADWGRDRPKKYPRRLRLRSVANTVMWLIMCVIAPVGRPYLVFLGLVMLWLVANGFLRRWHERSPFDQIWDDEQSMASAVEAARYVHGSCTQRNSDFRSLVAEIEYLTTAYPFVRVVHELRAEPTKETSRYRPLPLAVAVGTDVYLIEPAYVEAGSWAPEGEDLVNQNGGVRGVYRLLMHYLMGDMTGGEGWPHYMSSHHGHLRPRIVLLPRDDARQSDLSVRDANTGYQTTRVVTPDELLHEIEQRARAMARNNPRVDRRVLYGLLAARKDKTSRSTSRLVMTPEGLRSIDDPTGRL